MAAKRRIGAMGVLPRVESAVKRRVGAMGVLPHEMVGVESAAKRRAGAMGVLPHEMVWEILTWLPTKSLMRFKAVSKLWLSDILDPKFARARRAPFRGLLAMDPDPSIQLMRRPTKHFLLANFDGGESNNPSEVNFSFQFCVPKDLRSFEVSNMVNGIICFYNRNVAKLCNIATREIISLPESKYDYESSSYHLGFDPIQSVYKIVKICPILSFRRERMYLVSIECEILTLGVDSSWRSIDPPPNAIIPQGICVDGVLYMMTVVPAVDQNRNGDTLYSFNLAAEKFQTVSYPDDFKNPQLVQFGTCPALTRCRLFEQPEKITVAHYREGLWSEIYKYNPNIFAHVDPNYSEEKIYELKVRGLLPNGSLMICSGIGVQTDFPIYVFNQTRNYIQKFIIKFPASHSHSKVCGRICWYEENIISLKRLTGF